MFNNIQLLDNSISNLEKLKKGFEILHLTGVSEQLNLVISDLKKILIKSDKGVFDEIIEVITGMRWKEDRWNAAMTWCKANSIAPTNAVKLFEIVGKGEDKSDKSEKAELIGWRIPSANELKTFIKHRKKSKDYINRRTWCLVNDSPHSIGLNSFVISNKIIKTDSTSYFAIIVRDTPKGLKFKPLDGLFTYKQLLEKIDELNLSKVKRIKKAQKTRAFIKGSGARRSSPKINNTKFKTGMKYVSFHYAFCNMKNAPKNSHNFTMRGYIAKSDMNPVGIKIKDFEVNDTGMVNARYYIDSEIKRLGLDIPLYFREGDYKFIEKYGPRMWIKFSGFESGFDYDKNKRIIIDRYFDINDKYTIDDSFAKRVIIDTKPNVEIEAISAKLLSNITTFK